VRQAGVVTGGAFLGLILLSMAWLFFLYSLALHWRLLLRSLRAKESAYQPASLGFVPGLAGSLAVLFTIPELAKYGIGIPWPWFWILLPLLVDPYCFPILVLLLLRRLRGWR
jgi:hypothetical protein